MSWRRWLLSLAISTSSIWCVIVVKNVYVHEQVVGPADQSRPASPASVDAGSVADQQKLSRTETRQDGFHKLEPM